ncbi:MAG: serine hydrolase [Bacilli bacterium]|nr:serine hydrolase [Bacilli bacterium]
MSKIYMMIGIPGSGKTTFVKKLQKELGLNVVSTDIVRAMHPGINEKDVWPLVYEKIGQAVIKGEDVIFDATNVTKTPRNRFKDNINKYSTNYELIGYYFPMHYSICIGRVAKRNEMPGELPLPIDCIASYGESIYPPTYEEGFKELHVVTLKKDLVKDIIYDGYQGCAFYFKEGFDISEEYSGFSDITKNTPVRKETCFRLASVSKQFIAYGILTLVDKGLLSLDTSLFDLFKDMPKYTKNITIKNLLNHTSGIYDYEDMPHTEAQVSDRDVLDFVRGTKETYFEIGSKYQYSNTAYVLLGLIIEEVSKVKLGDYMEENVFIKAEMTNTKVDYEGITEITPRAYGNIVVDNKLVQKDQYWCSATIGDGGIYSNIPDLKRWISFLKGLNKEPYSLMKKTNFINGSDIEYGFGLRVKHINVKGEDHEIIYHCGDTIGTNTILGYIDDLDIEFILLTNRDKINTSVFIENLKNYLNK